MFGDPIFLTVNSVAMSMPRVLQDGMRSEYQTNDLVYKEIISHQPKNTKAQGERVSSMTRVDQRAIVTNPLDSTKADYDTLSVWFVLDRPVYGFSLVQVQQLVAALVAQLDSTMVAKLFGGES